MCNSPVHMKNVFDICLPTGLFAEQKFQLELKELEFEIQITYTSVVNKSIQKTGPKISCSSSFISMENI